MQIWVSNHECLLDDALQLHQQIEKTGGHAELIRRDHLMHVWQVLHPLMPESDRDLKACAAFGLKYLEG
jgi:epsilon-lactone hydrolase